MSVRWKLYKLAIWYVGKCNKKYGKPTIGIDALDMLTFTDGDKAYLKYGMDNEWKNFSRYDVLNNAIQKLAEYENGDN